MTEDEKRINNIDSRVSSLETKFEMFMRSQDEKFSNFMQEMRDRDNQRAAEIMELRQDMKTMQASLDSKIDSMGKHVRNLSVAAMAAVGGMFVAVGVMFIMMIYTLLNH